MLWMPSTGIWVPPSRKSGRIERPKRKRPPFPGADELEDCYAMPAGCVNVMGGSVPSVVTFLSDSMTGTDGTLLTAHSPEVGGAWTQNSGSWVLNGGFALGEQSGVWGLAKNAATPLTADYTVTAHVKKQGSSNLNDAGPAIRLADVSNGYFASIGPLNTNLWKWVAGVGTAIGGSGDGITTNQTRKLAIQAVGTTLHVYVDDVLVITVTDTTFSAKGTPGIAKVGTTASTPTTGMAIDDVVAVE